VTCRYSGRPPRPYRSGGTEYHVTAPSNGHIPDQYLAFEVTGPVNLPHCHAKPTTGQQAADPPTGATELPRRCHATGGQ
jgi:hypothetical protein